MHDINDRSDLEELMRRFYARAIPDAVIGHYFGEVTNMDLEKHLPLITDFWETIVFGVTKYKGNAIQVHQHLHQLSAFKDEHFERWVTLFTSTVNELFEGERAELIKQRATSIATVMRMKTVYDNKIPIQPK